MRKDDMAVSEIKLEAKLVGEIEGKFFAPSYQRGYRWGVDEVTRLLDDIYANGTKNYCLQPIVVKNNGNKYELIDGQQRLTRDIIILDQFIPQTIVFIVYVLVHCVILRYDLNFPTIQSPWLITKPKGETTSLCRLSLVRNLYF